MSPAGLLSDLNSRGIELQPNGDKLRIVGADRLTPTELADLRRHKAVIIRMLQSEGIQAATADRYPIIPGHVHFDRHHDLGDLAAGRWGAEFVPGYHVSSRQPSTLSGLCRPPKSASRKEQG